MLLSHFAVYMNRVYLDYVGLSGSLLLWLLPNGRGRLNPTGQT